MWPATAWIVTGVRPSSDVDTGSGPTTRPPAAEQVAPDETSAESVPKRSTWSKTAAVRLQSRPFSFARHARARPGWEQEGLDGCEVAGGHMGREHGA